MGDSEMLCNFRSCRRPLHDVAWVTFCSHIFCDVHGKPLSQVPVECPACGAKLAVEIDIRRVNVNPSEHFKSMVLAGLKPTVVMEVCHRALTFWSYQKEQEQGYQRHIISKLRERLQQVEAHYEQAMRTRDEHLANVRRQLHDTRMEHEKCLGERRATNELLAEKTRQYQKLQVLYDALRKRTGSLRSRSLSPPNSVGPSTAARAPVSPQGCGASHPPRLLALTAEDHQAPGPPSPRNYHHHQQNVQQLSQPTQQQQLQPIGRSAGPRTAPYHLPVHFSHLTSLLPHQPYHDHRRDLGTHGVHALQVGRYQNPPQEYGDGGGTCQNHAAGPIAVRPGKILPFLGTPRRCSSEDFNFRPAIFTDRGGDDQGGSGDPSRNDRHPPV